MATDSQSAFEKRVERQLREMKDEHGAKLTQMEKALSELVRQGEEMKHMHIAIGNLQARVEAIDSPTGYIAEIRQFQASCPRRQNKWMWWVIIPMGIGLLAQTAVIVRIGWQCGALNAAGAS